MSRAGLCARRSITGELKSKVDRIHGYDLPPANQPAAPCSRDIFNETNPSSEEC